jgi:hypothetical protein
MKPVFHPSHSSWKSLRDSHIPNASTAGDILSSDRAWPAFIQNQSRFPRKGLVNSLPGTKRKSSAGALTSARFGFLMRAHQARGNFRVALRQEQAAEEGGGRRAATEDRRGAELLPQSEI